VYRLSIDFHNRLMRGEIPTQYIVIDSHLGSRAYAMKELNGAFTTAFLEKSGRVLDFGSFERTLQPRTSDILTSYSSKQLQHVSISLDNTDRYFSRLIAKEPFLGRPISYWIGFENRPQTEHISKFKGKIIDMTVMQTLTIEADEK